MESQNQLNVKCKSCKENVAIIRVTAAAFAAQLEFTLSEIDEIKVALSEAVSNAVIHGYGGGDGVIEITMNLFTDGVEFIVRDFGIGIENIALARQPSFSTDPERMGLGFMFMESFMNKLAVDSVPGQGTTVTMLKRCSETRVH